MRDRFDTGDDVSLGGLVIAFPRLVQGQDYLYVTFTDKHGCTQSTSMYYVGDAPLDQVVTTALKAWLSAVEHEAREAFLYKGQTIFGPHQSVENLVKLKEAEAEHPGTRQVSIVSGII